MLNMRGRAGGRARWSARFGVFLWFVRDLRFVACTFIGVYWSPGSFACVQVDDQ